MKIRVCSWCIVVLAMLVGFIAWAGVEYPEALKSVVPVYPGAEVVAVMNVQNGSQAVMQVTDAPKEVIEFYRKALTKKGWTMVADMKQENTMVIILSKGRQM